MIILLYLVFSSIGVSPFSIEYQLFIFILIVSQIFWQELIFRGLILTILLKNRGKKRSIILNAFIFTLFNLISLFSLDFILPLYVKIGLIFLSFGIGVLVASICIKTNSILPGIFVQLILYLTVPISLYSLALQVYWILL